LYRYKSQAWVFARVFHLVLTGHNGSGLSVFPSERIHRRESLEIILKFKISCRLKCTQSSKVQRKQMKKENLDMLSNMSGLPDIVDVSRVVFHAVSDDSKVL